MKKYGTKLKIGKAKNMYKIKYMDETEGDLFAIATYLDEINSELAKNHLGKIKEHISKLDSMHSRFPKHRQRPQYRWCSVYNYMIFYKVVESTKTVEIHRILHGARDIENLITE
jgi:plasmid stabilization system protein ParE